MEPIIKNTQNSDKGFSKFLLTLILLIGLFAISFSIAYFSSNIRLNKVTSFPECETTPGSVIQESYPRVCRLTNGKTFTEEVVTPSPSPNSQTPTITAKECITSGCNNEICQDASIEPRSSICIYRPEFECYKTGACEVQKNGECGWTVTDELVSCLNKI